MKKIKISITVNSIYFSFTNKGNEKNLNQTSYVETGNLIFEYDYIVRNSQIISSFIEDITRETKINKVKIKNLELVPVILKTIKNNSNITQLYILDNKLIDTKSFLTIVDNKYIKYLSCYDMPVIMFNYLNERKDILIELQNEFKNSSKLIIENKLTKYSNIYYKKCLNINHILDESDFKDLETFFIVNRNLQIINIKKYDLDNFKQIYALLKKHKKKKIRINIYQNNINLKNIYSDIDALKKLKNKNINIKVIYEKEFIFKNFFKQINLSMIRFSLLMAFIALILIFGITEYTSAKEDEQTTDIVNNIQEILEESNEEVLDEIETEVDVDIEEIISNQENTNTNKQNQPNAYQTNYEKVFSKLKAINDDTVGWLTVKNTKVDYPVVQYKDNDYYLKHSFDNKKNSKGWIFADYRNNLQNLDDNTIIYGHNLKSGYMFGTLKEVLNPSWYNNSDNRIIIFNTEQANYSWQIFSIYTIEKNNDYLVSTFANETNFNNYITLSKSRSIIDFGITVNYGDNVLTLSTCYMDSNHRLIIQAKLIK